MQSATLLSSKLVRREGNHYVPTLDHWCQACETMHSFAIEQPFRNGARWTFNGDVNNPSFTPSMNIRIGPDRNGIIEVCHYFLTASRISYCSDSSHSLSGQTVDLLDIPRVNLIRMGVVGCVNEPAPTTSSEAPTIKPC